MESQARREKQLKIAAAAVVVVVLAGIVGVVVWNNLEQARAEVYAAEWTSCEYPPATDSQEKVDPAEFEDPGEEFVAEAERQNEQIDEAEENKTVVDTTVG